MEIKVINNIPGVKANVQETPEGFTITVTGADRQRLGSVSPGSVVKIGNREFIVLEQNTNGTCVIAKDFAATMVYDDSTGDYQYSQVGHYCEHIFADSLAAEIGKENLYHHTVDLTAFDGSGAGKSLMARASILTLDRFRKYGEILSQEMDDWWWLATRVSYNKPDYARGACCVGSDGIPVWVGCDDRSGVRPFCVLNPELLVLEA